MTRDDPVEIPRGDLLCSLTHHSAPWPTSSAPSRERSETGGNTQTYARSFEIPYQSIRLWLALWAVKACERKGRVARFVDLEYCADPSQ